MSASIHSLYLSIDVREATARLARTEEVRLFLDSLWTRSQEGFPPYLVARRAYDLWEEVEAMGEGQLPTPLVSLDADGAIQFTWRTPRCYLEVEVLLEGCRFYTVDEMGGTEDEGMVPHGLEPVEHLYRHFARFLPP